MEVIFHALKCTLNSMEVIDKNRHVSAPILVLILHVILLNRSSNLFLQDSDLIQFEILQCFLQNILKSIFALLYQLSQRFLRFVTLWIDDLDLVSVHLCVSEFDLALVDCELNDVVAQRVISMIT